MEITLQEDERLDDLLLGNFRIVQNVKYYRFTSDSILLSRFARARAGEEVADFCAGSGIVGLHFYALHTNLVKTVTLFEMQEELCEMSRKTIALNDLADKFFAVNCKIQEIPSEYVKKFSLILCNPPYEKGGFENKDYKKAVCRKELFLTLDELAEGTARCLQFGGRLALCHRADRVAEVLCTLHARGLEPKRLQFVAGNEKAPPYLALIEATKGGKAGVEVLPLAVNKRLTEKEKGGIRTRSLL